MKKMTISHKTHILLKVLVPGLVGMTMLGLEATIQHIFSHTQTLESSFINNELHLTSQNLSIRFLESTCEVLKGIGRAIFASYANYSTFMLLMLLVNVILFGSAMIQYHFTKETAVAASSHYCRSLLLEPESRTDRVKQILKPIILYSLIFCFYQVLWIWIGLFSSSIPLQTLHGATDIKSNVQRPAIEMMAPNRIMEQLLPLPFPEMPPDMLKQILEDERVLKPSLSIGKIVGQADVLPHSIKLSRDRKTAFVTTDFPSTLKIIDVTDPEYPVILQPFPLVKNSSDVIFTTLTLSSDETKAFISNVEYLHIVDIKNVKSPGIIGMYHDKAFIETTQDHKIKGRCKPNLILSKDNKFLFVSGYGLQIFDISVPKSPVLVRSLRSQINSGLLVPASIALSDDGKTLYYSDGALWIYNIEDPRNMKILSSFNSTSDLITSMVLSDDAKTAFILGWGSGSSLTLRELDLSNIFSIKEYQLVSFVKNISCQPVFLEKVPKNYFLFILFFDASEENQERLFIFDPTKLFSTRPLLDSKVLIKNAVSVLFTEDYRRVFFGNKATHKLQIADFYLEYPNKNAFTISENFIQERFEDFKFLASSKNENIFYGISDHLSTSTSKFVILRDLFIVDHFKEISTYEIKEKILQMVISSDENRAYWVSQTKVLIADITNSEVQPITLLGDFPIPGANNNSKYYLTLSRSGKTGCLQVWSDKGKSLEFLDLSNPKKVTQKGSLLDLSTKDAKDAKPILSVDDRTVFILSNGLYIYNISDPSHSSLLKNLSLDIEEEAETDFFIDGILSPDGNILFVRHGVWNKTKDTLRIIDVSNVTSPKSLGKLRLPSPKKQSNETTTIFISQDLKTVYLATSVALMIVDVTDLGSPRYLRLITVLKSPQIRIKDFCLTSDGRKAYVLTNDRHIEIVTLGSEFSTFLVQDTLMLGERYSMDLRMLKMDLFMNYHQIDSEFNYKFTKFALIGSHSDENVEDENIKLQTPPSWITFDLKSQTLTVEPRRKNDIQTYQLYFSFSTQIQEDAFSSIDRTINFEDLKITLLTYGFIDNQGFLTERFGTFRDFLLPSQYALVKKDIYSILKKYAYRSFNELRIISSLNVTYPSNKLKISTTSLSNINVEISLMKQEAHFLSKRYGSLVPIINDTKSQLFLEGSLKDINQALQDIVIDLQNITSTDGWIFVDDKLNPPVNEKITNISNYFNHNKPPSLNKNLKLSVQDQIIDVYTGEDFEIKLNQGTFSDSYTPIENLSYQLKWQENKTADPEWISFSNMTLMGKAPEPILYKDFKLKLIVKNEFQEIEEHFLLRVRMSWRFVLKLLWAYSPYIFTIIGYWIWANKIFNIVFKATYKHSKEFHVRIGQEITPEVIFPISFIQEEIQQAQKILKLIEKQIANEYRVRSINKRHLMSYFILEGERKINKSKVLQAIDSSLSRLTEEQRRSLDLYFGELDTQQLVNQIIFNTLTSSLLTSKEERETQVRYSKIKDRWPEIVEWDLNNSCFN